MQWLPILLLLTHSVISKSHDHDKDPLEHDLEEIYKHYADYLCPHIDHVDCNLHNAHHDEVLCGSDLRTYADHCSFAVARCNDSTLTVRHKGPCDTVPAVTPTGVDPAFAVIKNIFCQNAHLITCGTGGTDNICATDGIVYNSQCMFSKTKCYKTDIEVTDASVCNPTTVVVQTTGMPQTTISP